MNKLLFIYDKLMMKDEQALTEIPLEFISLGQASCKLRWVNDTKRRRLFAVPHKGTSTRVTYGGIFLLKEYEHNMHKLHSYYHNSIPFTERTMREDLYDFSVIKVRPLKVNTLQALADGNYEVGDAIECNVFVGNERNVKIQNSLMKRYYEHKSIHPPSFLQMVKENFNTKEE